MLLDKFSGRNAFDFLKNLAVIRGAFKAQPIRGFVDFHILFQKQDFCSADFFLCYVFGKTDIAGLFKERAEVIGAKAENPGHLV